MIPRRCKVLLVAACAFHWTLVVFNNLVDYGTNFRFVAHVLSMDAVRPEYQLSWRAFHQPWTHHAAYWSIIAWESLVVAVCWLGVWRTARHVSSSVEEFERSKDTAVLGITLVLLLFFCGFTTLGGEWFMMWQSHSWSGMEAAGRLFLMHAVILVWLTQSEGPLQAGREAESS